MNSQRVYSTQSGRICPGCDRPVAACMCSEKTSASAGDGVVRIRREVKGRKGKTVTTIAGVPASESAIRELASELKRHLGTGGSVKDGIVVIQGDHRTQITRLLEKRGYTVKRAGG